jgi:putative FmdB family regulatory protein
MPIYEYWCYNCQKKVSLLRPASVQVVPACPQCGNNSLHRLFSTFSVRKTYKDIYEDILSDNRLISGMLANDPRALAEWNRRISRDEPVAPEYQEMLDRMEHGEMPDLQSHSISAPEQPPAEG